jgi:2-succinyl-5-enolpyruvyl-6-hydroxy-3-cyclohexene-1-carboxylate synthase
LSRSVPSASEAQATCCATIFDEWIDLGLSDVVICPGSRSTPLALAAAARDELTLHVRLDERSAGFFALGRALVTQRPVAIVVTSGTAAAELHACVVESDLAFVPLLVVTADRPPELHGVGAPQTIEQAHLYGATTRRFVDLYPVSFAHAGSWRTLARELWSAANDAAHAGPVHLNAAFVEPLVADALDLPEPEARADHRDETPAAALDVSGQRVLCVLGRGATKDLVATCRDLDWVVLGDATSSGTLAYYDPLLRSASFAERVRPDVVVRLGGLPASKILAERLRGWGARTIALGGAGFVADPDRLARETLEGLPSRGEPRARGDAGYVVTWLNASREVDRALTLRDVEGELDEIGVARAVVTLANASDTSLVIGSSMPIRDVEWWATPRRTRVFANRGANGIDGVVSTFLGVAAGSRAIALVGDLTMLHDVSGLVDGLGPIGGTAVLVVADNDGGGIFSFLSQAELVPHPRFEQLFGTPRAHQLDVLARALGHAAQIVTTTSELREAVEAGLDRAGVSVVVARVPSREDNVVIHDRWNGYVENLLGRA